MGTWEIGNIDNSPIGQATPKEGTFTELKASTDPADEHGVGDRGYNDARYSSTSLFDANTILKADSDDTPVALTVPEQTMVGRITAGVIAALTPTQIRNLLNIADGADVTGDNAPQAHKDSHDPEDGSDAVDTASPSELIGVQGWAIGTSHSLARADHSHQIQHGITDNHLATIDDADAADNDYVKFTTNGLEGRDSSETKTDLGYMTDMVDDIAPELGGDLDCGEHIVQGDNENNLNMNDLSERILALMTDPRFLNVRCDDPSGGASSYLDISGKGHHGTPQGSWTSGDRTKENRGWKLEPDGTTTYINLGDSDDFTFDDSAGEAVSWIMLIEIGGAANNTTISKNDSTTGSVLREWFMYLESGTKPKFIIYDNTNNVNCSQTADTALSAGFHVVVVTYDGSGGATAGNGIKIYVDGGLVASTVSNNGAYVKMRNLTTEVYIGAYTGGGGTLSAFRTHPFGFMGIDAVAWSAMDVSRLWQLTLANYSSNGVDLS